MKKVKDILYKISVQSIIGSTEVDVKHITFDSRNVLKNSLFIALLGADFDGHTFIDNAIKKGARVIICQSLPSNIVDGKVYVVVEDSRIALSLIASNFYDNPSEKLDLIGITGTNGKTTISTLLHKVFNSQDIASGLISTVEIKFNKRSISTNLTTPDPLTINSSLDKMIKLGVKKCFMEVSSHGIDQKRINGLRFRGILFTNLTHDHLDYHKTFKNYRDVKKQVFDSLSKDAFALINLDDRNAEFMLQNSNAKKYTYALNKLADFNAKILENQMRGMLLKIKGNEIWTQMLGEFNAYNLLAVFATSIILGLDELSTLKKISQLEGVPGRFQIFYTQNNIMIIIDYAHTPDALKNILSSIDKIRTKNENLLTIIGCGGDRDKKKRPKIGEVAAKFSSKVIFTSDNPRNEDPELIIEEMIRGVSPVDYKKTSIVIKRDEAISTAYKLSIPGDIVLIAGKGHESFQEIKGKKYPFNDLEYARKIFTKT
ncbi:MAG: UDP-N-acetylmuramoyl-L-alanyl-D-glutamate--2,6-diaminopimelate ligase [Flavobacteriaceae bacterium]|jgi:UDP-N-acetylmuramoyl-L-alanyl-D-glutamate--2,6-diaminopimelate ligase|nr:UDP-N-acetylmuramoyl-L-alanyl-D-glutamate--2,6-diaminopimelate ligase [Flavobacteriaceae bacterium]